MGDLCALNDKNFDAYINCYIGKLCSVEKFKIQPSIQRYTSYFLGSKYVAFDLKAFCDYQSKPRFGHVHQEYRQEEGMKVLYKTVTGLEYQRQNCDYDLFKNEVETKWFLFDAQIKDVLPEAQNNKNNEYCNVHQKLTPPSFGDWLNSIAVPVFSTEETAKKHWFCTQRTQRSKLAIIGTTSEDAYICYYYDRGNPELIKRALCGLKKDRDYCVFENIPYILLQRNQYDALCDCRERDFLVEFEKQCKKKGFCFNPKDLWNFHSSVKSGYLTVLSGMSGTGKSSIVKLYAEVLGKDNCSQITIPVSPAWTSDADLLGWYDPQKGQYHRSTELLNILEEAAQEKNKDRLYLICLDEMNLARVEHYFSQFLSAMEQYAPVITLYPGKYIAIGNNVRFVGTANIDDTTYNFADKVRDRANILQLTVDNYCKHTFKTKNATDENSGANKTAVKYNYEVLSFVKGYNDLSDTQEKKLLEFLWGLHKRLNKSASCFGVSPRAVRAIGTYLANYPKNDWDDLNMDALDFAVNQRVLTKLHGSEDLLNTVLLELESESSENTNATSPGGEQDKLAFLKKLTTCKKTIAEKKKELKVYGYCP